MDESGIACLKRYCLSCKQELGKKSAIEISIAFFPKNSSPKPLQGRYKEFVPVVTWGKVPPALSLPGFTQAEQMLQAEHGGKQPVLATEVLALI